VTSQCEQATRLPNAPSSRINKLLPLSPQTSTATTTTMAPTHKRKLSDGDGVLDAPTDAPPKRQKGHVCHTCEDFKANNQFPLLHDPGHEHDRNTCRGCYRDWLLIQLETEKWDEIQCPECELQLSMKAMSKILNAVEYRRYVLDLGV